MDTSTTVAADTVVSIDFTLRVDGNVIDSSTDKPPLQYLHGYGNLLDGLENQLLGKRVGDSLEVKLLPEQAFGVRDPDNVRKVERDSFPADVELQPGMQFQAEGPDEKAVPIWVLAIEEKDVIVDLNHPLAGHTLEFAVEVREIRSATEEELQHGHPHGPGQCHDH